MCISGWSKNYEFRASHLHAGAKVPIGTLNVHSKFQECTVWPIGNCYPLSNPNDGSDHYSKHTLCTPTFDFIYWGKFLGQNLKVYVQENFLKLEPWLGLI